MRVSHLHLAATSDTITPSNEQPGDVRVEITIPPEKLEKFLIKIMAIQKRYAHELRNVKADRRGEVLEEINRFSSKELEQE